MRSLPSLQNRKRALILLSILLFIAIITVYLFAILPLKSELKVAKSELAQQEKQLETIQNGQGLKETQLEESTAALQTKVPIKPLLEQFLLDLEQAETVSNSFIASMTFDEGNESIIEGNVETNTVEDTSTSEAADGEQTEKNTESNRPTGIKKLTAFITVQSPGYFELEQFIDTLEKLERITKVEQIDFSGFPEIVSTNQGVEELTYTLTVSTFYYPGLEELVEFDPELDAPDPSNKNNPLAPYKNNGHDQNNSIETD